MNALHDNVVAQQSRPPDAGSAATVGDGDAIDILLVEDSYGDALRMMNALNAANLPYTVERIDNGDEVLPYLERASQKKMPDIIFLDMELPGTDGFEILERLAAASAHLKSVPIVVVTIQSNFNYLKETYDLPIYGHLTKPINIESVRTILSDVSRLVDAKRQAVR